MSDDINEFLEKTETYVRQGGSMRHENEAARAESIKESAEAVINGKVCQYSRFGGGFTPTTATVISLPPACYNFLMSPDGMVFVEPTAPPTGLLLELPEMRSEDVIKMTNNFWDSEKDYKDGNEFVCGGAAFKAGILLYGPPGSGKSCTLKIVSRKLVEKGGTVFYAHGLHPGLVQMFLTKFATIEKDRKCVVILEDLDSLIQMYGEAAYLNMLDSAESIDNVLFIATTNYPDRLDPRIYNRPGRFSQVVKIGNPGAKAREAFLKAILKNYRDVPYIVEHSDGFSIDHLSALVNAVYREKKELGPELSRLRRLFKIPKIDEGGKMGLNVTGTYE